MPHLRILSDGHLVGKDVLILFIGQFNPQQGTSYQPSVVTSQSQQFSKNPFLKIEALQDTSNSWDCPSQIPGLEQVIVHLLLICEIHTPLSSVNLQQIQMVMHQNPAALPQVTAGWWSYRCNWQRSSYSLIELSLVIYDLHVKDQVTYQMRLS